MHATEVPPTSASRGWCFACVILISALLAVGLIGRCSGPGEARPVVPGVIATFGVFWPAWDLENSLNASGEPLLRGELFVFQPETGESNAFGMHVTLQRPPRRQRDISAALVVPVDLRLVSAAERPPTRGANDIASPGTLRRKQPSLSPSDKYIYDPLDTRPGAVRVTPTAIMAISNGVPIAPLMHAEKTAQRPSTQTASASETVAVGIASALVRSCDRKT